MMDNGLSNTKYQNKIKLGPCPKYQPISSKYLLAKKQNQWERPLKKFPL
jgi:hypothetical protein